MKIFLLILVMLVVQFSVCAENIVIDNIENMNIANDSKITLQEDKIIKKQKKEYFNKIFYKTLYLSLMSINQNKIIPDNKFSKIEIEVDKNGNLLSTRVINSINDEIDNIFLNALNKSAPFEKFPKEWNIETAKYTYVVNGCEYIAHKIKNNANIALLKNDYHATLKVFINKQGKILNAEIVKTSNSDLIDKELVDATLKIDNFIEILDKDVKDSFYLTFRSVVNKVTGWKFDTIISQDNSNNDKFINWVPFLKRVEKEAKRNWDAYIEKNNYKVKVLLILDKDGKIIERKIIQSSGTKKADNAVLMSVDAGVYPRLPEGYLGDTLPVELTFDYNIYSSHVYDNYHSVNKFN